MFKRKKNEKDRTKECVSFVKDMINTNKLAINNLKKYGADTDILRKQNEILEDILDMIQK